MEGAVKTVLTCVAVALGAYQLVLASVGWGWVRTPVLAARPAFRAHRAIGDTIAALVVVVAGACVVLHGLDELGHALAGGLLVLVLAAKVAVVRRGFGLGQRLPVFGVTVFALLVLTLATSGGFEP